MKILNGYKIILFGNTNLFTKVHLDKTIKQFLEKITKKEC